MSKTSPTQRTLAHCRALGWPAQVVEHWVAVPSHPGGGVRRDLFGCIDVVALDEQPGVLGIQACAGPSAAARLAKADALPAIQKWLARGNRFQVWAWRKAGPRGKRKTWQLRTVDLESGAAPAEGTKEER